MLSMEIGQNKKYSRKFLLKPLWNDLRDKWSLNGRLFLVIEFYRKWPNPVLNRISTVHTLYLDAVDYCFWENFLINKIKRYIEL